MHPFTNLSQRMRSQNFYFYFLPLSTSYSHHSYTSICTPSTNCSASPLFPPQNRLGLKKKHHISTLPTQNNLSSCSGRKHLSMLFSVRSFPSSHSLLDSNQSLEVSIQQRPPRHPSLRLCSCREHLQHHPSSLVCCF